MSIETQREQADDKHSFDIEVLLQETEQIKFELKAADSDYKRQLEEKDKIIAELKEALLVLIAECDAEYAAGRVSKKIFAIDKANRAINNLENDK